MLKSMTGTSVWLANFQIYKRLPFLVFSLVFFSSTALSFDESKDKENIQNDIEVLEPLITIASEAQKIIGFQNLTEPVNSDEKLRNPSNLTELINNTPSVSQNGQGGHFQSFSIRGVSRHRVKTLINGMRIVSDRRAGVSASFIDPLLIGDAIVWRIPTSTQFGSGALGGAVEVEPHRFSSFQAMAGYSSLGNEHFQLLGVGQDKWSVGIARREASNANAADGSEINTHFTQYSATFSAETEWQGLNFNFFALPAVAVDIGKSNTDFPSRETNYPEEKHLLVRFGVSSDEGWSSHFYIHPNNLETKVHKKLKSINTIYNDAFNFGADWQIEKIIGDVTGIFGMDYFGRRNINITEKALNIINFRSARSHSLKDGEDNEFGLFSSIRGSWGNAQLQAGLRFSYFNQTQSGASIENDMAWSGFLELSYPFENGLSLSANFATGFRFPSLSERFFSGATGRGEVIGNPDLKTEQSLNFDLGAEWIGSDLIIEGHVFYLQVYDYIERVELTENVLTFVNLSQGRILGAELESRYLISEQLSFSWSGHFLHGRDNQGNALSDIPSQRMLFSLEYKTEQWESMVKLEMRAEKTDPGNAEKDIKSAQLLSAAIRFKPHKNIIFSVTGSNLLNENYYNSANRKTPFSAQRSIGFNASWQM